MTHSECIKKLIAVGNKFGFYAAGRSYGKMYHMGNPDCVWYYKGPGSKELYKIAKGDKFKYLPFIAFEVPYSEKEKALRGTLSTLQMTSASAGIIVLIGDSAKYGSYLKKLVGRYSFSRIRIWFEKDVVSLYGRVMNSGIDTGIKAGPNKLRDNLRDNFGIVVGELSLDQIAKDISSGAGVLKVSGRDHATGKNITTKIPAKELI